MDLELQGGGGDNPQMETPSSTTLRSGAEIAMEQGRNKSQELKQQAVSSVTLTDIPVSTEDISQADTSQVAQEDKDPEKPWVVGYTEPPLTEEKIQKLKEKKELNDKWHAENFADNIAIMEGLLKKYPTALKELILENKTKVVFFDSDLVDQSDIPQKERLSGIVVFSAYGLSHILAPGVDFDLKPFVDKAITTVATKSPETEGRYRKSHNIMLGYHDRAKIYTFTKGLRDEEIPSKLDPQFLGKLMKRMEKPEISPEEILNQMP
jgi:hypothetical protein